MRVYLNNFSAALTADVSASDGFIQIEADKYALLKAAFDDTVAAYGRAEVELDLTLDDGLHVEIVRVQTFGDGPTILVERAQQGTVASTFSIAATRVELRVTAQALRDLPHEVASRIVTNGSSVLIGADGTVLTH